jgi:hypothetical protein
MGRGRAARRLETIFFRNLITSPRAYSRYEVIGCLFARNLPFASHRRSVWMLTPSSFAASATVIMSAGSALRRATDQSLRVTS